MTLPLSFAGEATRAGKIPMANRFQWNGGSGDWGTATNWTDETGGTITDSG